MDQYSHGQTHSIWDCFAEKTEESKYWLLKVLRENGCKTVLDCACGPGKESGMLFDEGFRVVSSDGSEEMVACTKALRDSKQGKHRFTWEVEKANWMTLAKDLKKPGDGFDAAICLGNAIPHLPNSQGDFREFKLALQNLYWMVKPGGIVICDHRNFDSILKTGKTEFSTEYKNILTERLEQSIIYEKGVAKTVILDYIINNEDTNETKSKRTFSVSLSPVLLDEFNELASEVFGGSAENRVYGDFKLHIPGQTEKPVVFLHVIRRASSPP
uniref:glycine N-methyltransferase-like n=1 Tax=Myxine glutinosa TaxID=7769 RepID=UPI00358F1445